MIQTQLQLSRHLALPESVRAWARILSSLSSAAKNVLFAAYLYCGYVQVRDWILSLLGRSRAVVLYYHRVGEPDLLTRSVEDFRRDLAWLRRHCECISLGELCRRLREKQPLRRRIAVITFDDGYRDNYANAMPALMEAGITATFFVSTGFIGTARVFPHDQRAAERGDTTTPLHPKMTWDELRAMQAAGYEIGSHTVTHADLGNADEGTARREVVESLNELNQQLGPRTRAFSFPWGKPANVSESSVKLAGEAGYYTVVTAFGGSNTRGDNPLHIRRLDAGNGRMGRLAWLARFAGLDRDYSQARRLLVRLPEGV